MTGTLNVAVLGPGWCGGIRAEACAAHPIVADLHLAEVNPERLAEVAAKTNPASTTDQWETLVARDDVDVVMVSATPETTHYPMAKAALEAGKHVLLEKPIALSLDEADDLIDIAESNNLKFSIAYSQRFNGKQAFAKRSIVNGSIGDPTSILVTRHIGRNLGAKIGNRIKLSPAAMEATHDIDFAMWCLEPRRPVRVYSQNSWGVRRDLGLPDAQLTVITMDDGVVVTVNAGMSLPNHYPNAATTWIEVIGTEGTVFADDSHRDIVHTTVENGIQFPLSTMPGEAVLEMYAGPMERETIHFLEAVLYDRPVMVEPRMARMTMEVYMAADLSADLNELVELPLSPEQAGLALAASVRQ
ncbi:MAG: Gfo/Idh/MocA family protein [Acidimicrobiales bacterium]